MKMKKMKCGSGVPLGYNLLRISNKFYFSKGEFIATVISKVVVQRLRAAIDCENNGFITCNIFLRTSYDGLGKHKNSVVLLHEKCVELLNCSAEMK